MQFDGFRVLGFVLATVQRDVCSLSGKFFPVFRFHLSIMRLRSATICVVAFVSWWWLSGTICRGSLFIALCLFFYGGVCVCGTFSEVCFIR